MDPTGVRGWIKEQKKEQRREAILAKELSRGMVNQRYGKWLVLKLAGLNGRRRPEYLCLCACGYKKLIESLNLRLGRSKQCIACYRLEMGKRSQEMNRRSVLKRRLIK